MGLAAQKQEAGLHATQLLVSVKVPANRGGLR